FGKVPVPQILNEPKSLYQSPSGTFGLRVNPNSKLIEVNEINGPVTHPFNEVAANVVRQLIPASDSGHQSPNTRRPSLSPNFLASAGSLVFRNFSASSKNSC